MTKKKKLNFTFAQAAYLPRVSGMLLGAIAVGSVLYPMNYGWPVWTALLLHALVWPHLAWQWARGSSDSVRAECRNLLVDHFLIGIWFVAMGFNLMPSAVIFTLAGMDNMIAGGRRQFERGCISLLAGIALGLAMFGLNWLPESTPLQVAACLPLLLLHPISIGHILFRALTQLKRQREELAHLSQHDGLTGLYNRRHWEVLVKTEFARFRRTGQVSTLVLIDLDHFKAINDAYGHSTGDEVLRRFAERLRTSLRNIDTPGRYGGEEFGILLPNTPPKEAGELMRRLQANIRNEPLLPQPVVTASFGLAGLTPDVPNHEAWMRLADQMLYRAKDRGRDCVVTAGDSRPAHLLSSPSGLMGLGRSPEARDTMPVVARVLSGLSLGHIAAALFDPSDRLVWANDVFMSLYAVEPSAEPLAQTFCDIIVSCHKRKVGPRIVTDDLAKWIESADTKRRSVQQRCFAIDTVDGRYFRIDEVSFHDGWLLDWWTEISQEQALLLSPGLKPSTAADGSSAQSAQPAASAFIHDPFFDTTSTLAPTRPAPQAAVPPDAPAPATQKKPHRAV